MQRFDFDQFPKSEPNKTSPQYQGAGSSRFTLEANGLTKQYRLYRRPVHRLKSLLMPSSNTGEVITALEDVSFQVSRGQHVGIMGDNGAGKSTLLKILAGVLTPTRGTMAVYGRVMSILELGIGFHPEFTGRGNIFFYGDLLGFSRDFLNKKVDEIIDFSELGDFIDRPVKTYSSGMSVRLAFSVVTAFEPEILILDEVLAVGDIHFQRKSLSRILNFRKKGVTILFCSHDTYHIRMLCDRALWLKEGRVACWDNTEKVVSEYESYQLAKEKYEHEENQVSSVQPVRVKSVELLNPQPLRRGDDMVFEIVTWTRNDDLAYNVTLSIKLKEGRGVYITGTHLSGLSALKGSRRICIRFPDVSLMTGVFYAHARVWDKEGFILYHEKKTMFFDVKKDTKELGICYLPNSWEVR
jgi:ABC-type polysaccharide/polyol phosphate transport system ATPase subunit